MRLCANAKKNIFKILSILKIKPETCEKCKRKLCPVGVYIKEIKAMIKKREGVLKNEMSKM